MFGEIEQAISDSNCNVLESLCIAYDKAYEILEQYTDDHTDIDMYNIMIQENGDQSDIMLAKNKDEKQGNIIVRIFKAVIEFFKTIAKKIKDFFKKAKDTVVDRLKKLKKKKDSECGSIQEELDNPKSAFNEKRNKRIRKFEKNAKVDESLTEGKKEKRNKKDTSDKTDIVIGQKKISTRIRFDSWKVFLEYCLVYIDKVSTSTNRMNDSLKSAIRNRPTAIIKRTSNKSPIGGEYEEIQGPIADLIGDIVGGSAVRKSRPKKQALFYHLPHFVTIDDVTAGIESVSDLLKKTLDKCMDTVDKFDKLSKSVQSYVDSGEADKKMIKLAKDLSKVHTELFNISSIVTAMTTYMSSELQLYDDLLDIFEIIEKKVEAKTKKKTDNPTINVNMNTNQS